MRIGMCSVAFRLEQRLLDEGLLLLLARKISLYKSNGIAF